VSSNEERGFVIKPMKLPIGSPASKKKAFFKNEVILDTKLDYVNELKKKINLEFSPKKLLIQKVAIKKSNTWGGGELDFKKLLGKLLEEKKKEVKSPETFSESLQKKVN
jgi:hypothetical protein